jgi:hypothetical protein
MEVLEMVSSTVTVSADHTTLQDIRKRGWSNSAVFQHGYKMLVEQKQVTDFETAKSVEQDKKIERMSARIAELVHKVWVLEEGKNV